jgi:hypothetical protein
MDFWKNNIKKIKSLEFKNLNKNRISLLKKLNFDNEIADVFYLQPDERLFIKQTLAQQCEIYQVSDNIFNAIYHIINDDIELQKKILIDGSIITDLIFKYSQSL